MRVTQSGRVTVPGKTPNHQDFPTRDTRIRRPTPLSQHRLTLQDRRVDILDSFSRPFGHPRCAWLGQCWLFRGGQVTRKLHSQNGKRDIPFDIGLELNVDVQVHVQSNGGGSMATVVMWIDLLLFEILSRDFGDLLR